MTPGACIAAAAGLLDRVLAGAAAEQVLTAWARVSRFAGSGDRARVRDHVYQALRCRRSFTALAGAEAASGRALMIGAQIAAGLDQAAVFTGVGHAPAALSADEVAAIAGAAPLPEAVALDCPDWLVAPLKESLGEHFAAVMALMRSRAPVMLRVNEARITRAAAAAALAAEGIATAAVDLAGSALHVTENASKIKLSRSYRDGLVELQDAAPQAAVAALPLRPGMRVLDYCAGGGGKVLAMAARAPGQYFAHDADPARMRDLPERARRAGVAVTLLDRAGVARAAPHDLVLVDVPCSGSGTWRRAPEAKWRLTAAGLADLLATQAAILDAAAGLVADGGYLCYMTCSLLAAENRTQARGFVARHPGWRLLDERLWTPLDGGDGFYACTFGRSGGAAAANSLDARKPSNLHN